MLRKLRIPLVLVLLFVVSVALVLLLSTNGCPRKGKRGGKDFLAEKEPPSEIAIDLGGSVKMEFILIPAGEFMMGCRDSPWTVARIISPGTPDRRPRPVISAFAR